MCSALRTAILCREVYMSELKMIAPAVPNVPWQDKPEGHKGAPVWRYSENPIIDRNPLENVARIFNSAVMPYEGKFIGVFRGEQTNGIPYIYLGRSDDGIHWNFDKDKIPFKDEDGNDFMPIYAYDPRLVKVEDTYYIIWCQDFYGAAIGMAKTKDFKTFTRLENPFLPFNRNAVLFPRKINGKFVLLSRPSDSGHTPFGDIFVSESPDLVYWGRHRHVMSRGNEWWESLKIGGGAAPIETTEGWLLFYHGVSDSIALPRRLQPRMPIRLGRYCGYPCGRLFALFHLLALGIPVAVQRSCWSHSRARRPHVVSYLSVDCRHSCCKTLERAYLCCRQLLRCRA